jgi:hypothetical protein
LSTAQLVRNMTVLHAKAQMETAWAELKRSYGLSDYEAVDVAWVALIKTANLLTGKSERSRLSALLESLPEDRVRVLLAHEAIDSLLSLDPPLETVLSMPHERLDPARTAKELAALRENRDRNPKLALLNLAEILRRIRNRRAHGFKTPYGLRDQQILGAAAPILRAVGELSIETVGISLGGTEQPCAPR